MSRLKTLVRNERAVPPLRGGHSLCQGCGVPMVVRTILDTIETPVVVVSATGCLANAKAVRSSPSAAVDARFNLREPRPSPAPQGSCSERTRATAQLQLGQRSLGALRA